MKEIIEKLTEWRENIVYDAKAEYTEDENRTAYTVQAIQIAAAIGLLQSIGKNNNIPE